MKVSDTAQRLWVGCNSLGWITSSTQYVHGGLQKIKKTKHAYHTLSEICISNSPPGIICCHQQQGQNEPWNAAVKQHLSHGVQYRATAAYKMSVCPHRWLVFIRIRLDPEIKCPSLSTMTVLTCSITHTKRRHMPRRSQDSPLASTAAGFSNGISLVSGLWAAIPDAKLSYLTSVWVYVGVFLYWVYVFLPMHLCVYRVCVHHSGWLHRH